jgi:hypothetical protein
MGICQTAKSGPISNFEFKIEIEQGSFLYKKLPGSKISLVGMDRLAHSPGRLNFQKKLFFCRQKKLMLTFSAQSPVK